MQQLFLYRLYRHNRAGFAAVILFIVLYVVFLYKKMDMTLFPLNSMFAYSVKNDSYTTSAYQLKINGNPVYSTHFPYWKKDFMEASLSEYAKYLQNDNKVYMHQYMETKSFIPGLLQKNLVPGEKSVANWLCWYTHFGGQVCASDAEQELIRYDLNFSQGYPVLEDSLVIYKTR